MKIEMKIIVDVASTKSAREIVDLQNIIRVKLNEINVDHVHDQCEVRLQPEFIMRAD